MSIGDDDDTIKYSRVGLTLLTLLTLLKFN